jgi:putative ABC transport system substrate-binding protein
MNNRRRILVALGGGTITAPFASVAQLKAKVWRIGFLSPGYRPPSFASGDSGEFLQGMRELGYVEGKNFVMEWRYAEGKYDRLPELAAELLQLRLDILVTRATPATRAAQKATSTVPIVMVNVGDPVVTGFIKNFARPGGNITGLSNLSSDTSPKLLEFLVEIMPKLARVAVLVNPDNLAQFTGKRPESPLLVTAKKNHVELLRVEARNAREIDSAFSSIREQKADALLVSVEPIFTQQITQIAELAWKNRLPSTYHLAAYAEAGGLITYGAPLEKQYRRAATYVDKILKGANPGELPVEQPMTFELTVNLKTAKALGLTIPPAIMVQATRVIE